MTRFPSNAYYQLRPLIPRRLQIALRRALIRILHVRHADRWPIDEHAGYRPEGWPGWPANKQFALVLTHDVEHQKGHDRCRRLADIESKYGFRSSFNFVPERYEVAAELRQELESQGFEIGVHGLCHDGKLFRSRDVFAKRASRINHYLKQWGAIGFRAPAMHRHLDWLRELDILYDASTFDSDPFEPQPQGVGTIFPFRVESHEGRPGYIELPYTLAQDFTLLILMRKPNVDIWKRKLDWIAERGGMALLNTHPDYMDFGDCQPSYEEYSVALYEEFLHYAKEKYDACCWHALPRDVAGFYAGANPQPESVGPGKMLRRSRGRILMGAKNRRIWIDLDNSPHVPFFGAIIPALQAHGFEVQLTARDAYQVCELAEQAGMKARVVGHHYGKNKLLKAYGTLWRTLQLLPFGIHSKPAIALSHGSRAHLLAGKILRIPVVTMGDYEHTTGIPVFLPDWTVVPHAIREKAVNHFESNRVVSYPGIKEDVYVPEFEPDATIRSRLGVSENSIMVTIRPPATAAHYHNPESELLFEAAVDMLLEHPTTQIVILPRTQDQKASIRERWEVSKHGGRVIIPEHVVDGLNLLWFSDFVISGGGTMNREAAALGLPVYSIFRGTIGGVDRYLSENGRLTLLESVEDIRNVIDVKKQPVRTWTKPSSEDALHAIIDGIISIIDHYNK